MTADVVTEAVIDIPRAEVAAVRQRSEDAPRWGRCWGRASRQSMQKNPDVSVQEFLRQVEPSLRRLAETARARILSTVPHATERVRSGWRLIGYNAPAYFAFISVERDHLRIGFEWGIMLPRYSGLLEGSGSQVRYVSIHSVSDVKRAELRALLLLAAAIVPPPRRRR